jgi:hypothetical protein
MTRSPSHAQALAGILLAASLAAPIVTASASAADTAARPTGTAKPLPAKPAMVMPWIEDDYTRAVAEAKARKVPIFVESWAPW